MGKGMWKTALGMDEREMFQNMWSAFISRNFRISLQTFNYESFIVSPTPCGMLWDESSVRRIIHGFERSYDSCRRLRIVVQQLRTCPPHDLKPLLPSTNLSTPFHADAL